MLDILNQYINTYNQAEFNLTYKKYLGFISQEADVKIKKSRSFLHYERVFNRLIDFKQDYFYIGEMYYLLSQLIFGLRFVEVASLRITNDKKSYIIKVNSSKGTDDRLFIYPVSSPLVSTLVNLASAGIKQFSYKEYSRALLKANPNFYKMFNPGHLAVSHVARHLYVQSLFYVLKFKKKQVNKLLGWKNEDTIDSYTDEDIFKEFKRD